MPFCLKSSVRQLFRAVMDRTRIECDRSDLEHSAIVFSPHPDDETLGCGGTIIRKKQSGADVKIVFMTDGSQSHAHLVPASQLKKIRASEALAAAQALGVKASDVIFLEFTDGTLAKNQDAAITKVAKILLSQQPQEIFIPYHQDGVPDHDFTNRIVIAALRIFEINTLVYEYPVWFWNHWPWTSFGASQTTDSNLRNSLGASLELLKNFRYSVYIETVLPAKQAALKCHQSQTQQLIPDSKWTTLGKISNGEFLDCFMQKREVFNRYMFETNQSHPQAKILSLTKHANV